MLSCNFMWKVTDKIPLYKIHYLKFVHLDIVLATVWQQGRICPSECLYREYTMYQNLRKKHTLEVSYTKHCDITDTRTQH